MDKINSKEVLKEIKKKNTSDVYEEKEIKLDLRYNTPNSSCTYYLIHNRYRDDRFWYVRVCVLDVSLMHVSTQPGSGI